MLLVYILVALTLTSHGAAPRYPNYFRNPNYHNNLRFTRHRYNFQEERVQIRATKPMLSSSNISHYPARRANEERPENPNLKNSHFCSIPPMTQHGATPAQASEYPWIARVVAGHRYNSKPLPLLCTAAAINFRTFITAARCIVTAKAEYTQIFYHDALMGVKAFIAPTPEEFTKQLFDDVALIISWMPWDDNLVEDVEKYFINETKQLELKERVDDNSYDFFERWAADDFTLVGYLQSEESPSRHELFVLDNMHASNSVCNKVYPAEDNSGDYKVPCVHSCPLKAHLQQNPDRQCYRYMFGLGHMVINKKGELIGIVTWTCGNHAEERRRRKDLPLPLGIAVPNKSRFQKDHFCALHDIARDELDFLDVKPGYFRGKCNGTYGYRLTLNGTY